jgi:hypothetical protein
MSQWTQVVGSISCDDFKSVVSGASPVDTVANIVGLWENEWFEYSRKENMYGPDSLDNRKSYGAGVPMPRGSEGSLKFNVQRIGSKSSVNNCLITFWGNLRDYGEPEVRIDLIEYLRNLVKRLAKNNIHVRAMAVNAHVEPDNNILITCNNAYKESEVDINVTEISNKREELA